MPQVINTNSMSLMARNNLNKSQSSLNSSIEKLSSGKRINSAKDGASESAIANRLTANIKGLTQAGRNANDGISISQTAEGALNEMNNNVQRIRELTVKAANGTNSDKDIEAIQKEIDQRLEEIDRISSSADFNGTKLFDKNAKDLVIQVGSNDQETITIKLSEFNVEKMGLKDFKASKAANGTGGDGGQAAVATNQLKTLDDALSQIDGLRSQFGAAQNRFESAISNVDNTIANLTSARSRIEDADYGDEISNMTRSQILQQAGTSVLAQANQVPQLVLSLFQ